MNVGTKDINYNIEYREQSILPGLVLHDFF